MDNQIINFLCRLIFCLSTLSLSACGGGGGDVGANGGSPGGEEVPEEVSFSTTLYYPGHHSIIFESSINLVGKVNNPQSVSVNQIEVESQGISYPVDFTPEGIFRVEGLQLSSGYRNEIVVSGVGEDDKTFSDVYTVYRAIPIDNSARLIRSEFSDEVYIYRPDNDGLYAFNFVSESFRYIGHVPSTSYPKFLEGDISNVKYSSLLSSMERTINDNGVDITFKKVNVDSDGAVFPDFRWSYDDVAVADEAQNRLVGIFTTTKNGEQLDEIFAIDLTTGSVTEISGREVGEGDKFRFAYHMALDRVNQQLFVVASGASSSLYKIDMETGNRTRLSAISRQIFYSESEQVLYANDGNRLLSVNPGNGASTVIFSLSEIESSLSSIHEIVYSEDKNEFVLLDNLNSSLAVVDATTGNLSSSISFGAESSHAHIGSIEDIYVHEESTAVYYLDTVKSAIGLFDISSHSGGLVSTDSSSTGAVGEGRNFGVPLSMALDIEANKGYVMRNSGEIVAVDLATGNRQAIESTKPEDGLVYNQGAIALNRAERILYIADTNLKSVFKLDIETGVKTVLANNSAGTFDFDYFEDMIFDEERRLLWIANSTVNSDAASSLVSVDVDTGAKRLWVDRLSGERGGPKPSAIVIDPITRDLYISSGYSRKIYRYDPDINQVSLVYSGSGTDDIEPVCAKSMDIISDARLLYIANGCGNDIYALDLDSNELSVFH